jgi:hypothetical protein
MKSAAKIHWFTIVFLFFKAMASALLTTFEQFYWSMSPAHMAHSTNPSEIVAVDDPIRACRGGIGRSPAHCGLLTRIQLRVEAGLSMRLNSPITGSIYENEN